MAKELPNGLGDFLQSRAGANFASWAVITLPLLQGSPSSAADGRIYHLATSKITIDGITYDDQLQRVGELRRSIDRAAEKVSIAIQNITGEFGTTLLGDIDVLHGATVTAGRWWQDQVTGAEWTEQTFTGVVDGASGDEQVITLECLSDLYAVRSVGGGRAADRLCPLVFNSPGIRASGSGIGDACGYAGGDTTCERTVAACTEKGNLHRYGGFVQIEANTASAVAAIKPATNYQLVKDADGETVAMASAVKVANAAVATVGNVTTINPAPGEVYYVDAAPYGAVGDGTTNDTTAIQAAIDAAYTAGGGTVYFGAKTYKNTGLVLKDNVWLVGENWRKTVLYSVSNADIVGVSTTAFNAGVMRLKIKGSVSAGSSQIGLNLGGNAEYWSPVVRDVWIEDTGSHGLKLNQYPFSPTLENIHTSNCAGYHFLFDCPIAPCITLRNGYAHTLRSGGACGFRIKQGRIVLDNCNGIDNAPALSGSNWATVGRKNGVDGDSTDAGATLILRDCNVEQFYVYGILAYSYSTIGVLGRTGFAGGNSGSHVGIMFDAAGDGSSYYAEHNTQGFIEDTVDFADGVAAYANSQPIRANGYAPIQILGRGPRTGGGAPLTTYYNTEVSAASKLGNAGRPNIQTVTATTTIAEPGVTVIEVNNTSGGAIDLTLPWGGWYQSGIDVVYIKDVAGNAATYAITVKGGGGYGTITTITQNGGALILTPDANTGTGAWRILSAYPTAGTISGLTTGTIPKASGATSLANSILTEAGGGVTAAGFLQANDMYVQGYSSSPSAAPSYNRRRHRGSAGSPAAVQSGDALAYESWQGQYDTTDGHRHTGAYITVSANENWDGTHAGTRMQFSVAIPGTTDGFGRKWILDGSLGTGWTTPSGTSTRTGFTTSTATAQQVAEALKALIEDLKAAGIITA